MLATILDGTRRTLDFAAASGARKLLYLSSGAVYGNIPQSLDRIEETYPGGPDPTNPKSAYGEGKRAGETMCACWGHELGIDVTVARCFATVGPGLALDGTYAIGNFINDVLNGRDIVIESDGTPVRTYIYVADLTAWLWTILLGGVKGRAYNVGSEEEISIRDTAETVRQVAGSGSKVIVKSTAAPGIAPNRYVPSTQRARTELGLAQWTTIESAIAKTFAYYARLRGVGASGGATRRAA
jgi:dTDP-glucose 4,6-dehydratase